MRRFVKIYFLLSLICSVSQAIDSAGSGNFTAGATWVGGVAPADSDPWVVKAGHTVTFDEDMSGWANGSAASQIEATGQLTIKDDAGTYYLKMNGDLDLDGTLQAGTSASVPFTGIFTIDFNSGSNSIVIDDTTGSLLLYCEEPTNKYVVLTAEAAAAQPDMSVDTDVTGDIWADGDIIAICDLVTTGGARDNEGDTIGVGGIAADTITCTNNLTAAKKIGTHVVLVSRNIRLIDSTDYAIKYGENCHIDAEIYNCNAGLYETEYSTIGGVICLFDGGTDEALYKVRHSTINAVLVQTESASSHYGAYYCSDNTFADESAIIGFYFNHSGTSSSTVDGRIASGVFGFYLSSASSFIGTMVGCRDGISSCNSMVNTGDIYNCRYAITASGDIIAGNCILGGVWPDSGVSSTASLNGLANHIRCYNVSFDATTEYSGYSSGIAWEYAESLDHDGTPNAYKAWCVGGIVTSQTASPPTGYTIWYEHACEYVATGSYPCFRQYETTVLPGTAIEVEGKIRIADGEDLSSDPPALQILDTFADPLVDSTKSPLDEDEIPEPDGGVEAGWQDVSVIWANQGDSPRQVIVRMYASVAAQVANVDVDEVWAIADYQDQIAAIYNKLPTNYVMGSSVQTDKDDEIDAILTDTAEIGAAGAGLTAIPWNSAWTAEVGDAVHDEVVEETITLRQAIRLFLSVMTGKSSGGGTTTITFRDIGDTKNRLQVTVDASGNRTAIGTRDGN